MIIRSLDGNHDFNFGKGIQSYVNNDKAIAENIDTRLLSFLNDCFFDMNSGIDWFRLLGTKNTKEEIILSCRAVILQSYGAVKVNKIDVVFDSNSRHITITYNIDTIFTQQFSQNLEVINA